jgi:hypothetical protein
MPNQILENVVPRLLKFREEKFDDKFTDLAVDFMAASGQSKGGYCLDASSPHRPLRHRSTISELKTCALNVIKAERFETSGLKLGQAKRDFIAAADRFILSERAYEQGENIQGLKNDAARDGDTDLLHACTKLESDLNEIRRGPFDHSKRVKDQHSIQCRLDELGKIVAPPAYSQ